MTSISIEDAQAKLPELIGGLAKGEELVITQGGRIVARIVGNGPNAGNHGFPDSPREC